MTIVEVRAVAQQETVIEKVFREVFLKSENGCRFTVEVRVPNGEKQCYNLQSLNKPAAQLEAEQRIQEIMISREYDRIAWRIVGKSNNSGWSLSSGSGSVQQKTRKKKEESFWNRFIDFFFDIDGEEN